MALPSIPLGIASTAYFGVSAATVLRTAPGVIGAISVITAGAAGGIFDVAATGTGTAARQVGVIPATVGIYPFNWPCATGIVVVPGAGQVLAITLA